MAWKGYGGLNPKPIRSNNQPLGVTGISSGSTSQPIIGVTGCFTNVGDPREDYTDEAKRAGNCDKCAHRLKSLCGDFCNEAEWKCTTGPKELVDPNMGDIEDEV
jgi:hypothetical protein